MKTFTKLAVCLCVLLINSSQLSADENFTFRNTRWGMSLEEVKVSEPLEPAQTAGDMIGYKTKVLQKDVLLAYIFADKKLVRAKYVLAERHSNKTDFIQDYKDFKKILTEKYGKPKREDVVWKDDFYKSDPSHWGMAVATGRLSYFSTWETSDSEIICALYGDNFNITCGVEYTSKSLRQIEKNIQQKKELNNF